MTLEFSACGPRKPSILLAVLLIAFLNVSQGMSSDLSKLLHRVFDEAAQRPPTGPEINHYSNVFRNQGSLEGYIQLMSSDDYFVTRTQRNWENYVSQLYLTFVGRPARGDEQRFWVQQFERSNRSRSDLVREFIRANRITQLPNTLPQLPAYPPPATNNQLAYELVSEVNLFDRLVSRELGGSSYGRRVLDRSRKLQTVSEQYREIVTSPQYSENHVSMSADNLERALQDLEREFYRVPGASYQADQVLHRISQLVSAAQMARGRSGSLPAVPMGANVPPTNRIPGAETWSGGQYSGRYQSSAGDVNQILASLRNFAFGLRGYQHQSPFYANLFRDVQGLAVQLQALQRLQARGELGRSYESAVQAVLLQADHINRDMQQADFGIQRSWYDLFSSLQSLSRAGTTTGSFFNTSHPVIIHQPAWAGVPYQPSAYARPGRNQQTIDLCDQLTTTLDGYINALRPLERSNSRVRPLTNRLQDLSHQTTRLRQSAANGKYGRQLSDRADDLMETYQRAAREFERMVASDASLNSPQFMQLGELIQRTQNAARGTTP